MDKTQKYFIHLLSSYLNDSPPLSEAQADWMGVFKLGELHNVTAMLTVAIKKLPAESRPPEKLFSLFKQALGMTIQSFENKLSGIEILTDVLSESEIKHLFVKGAAIRQYYPVGEVRTSGDTDVIVEPENLEKATNLLVERGFELSQSDDIQSVLIYNDEEYEVKAYLDGVNSDCEHYFEMPFEDKCVNTKGFAYNLDTTNHLVYIISHFLRHLSVGGVGIRQLMDIDVMLRCDDFNFELFDSVIKALNIEKSAMFLLKLSKEWFNSPIDIDFEIDEDLKESLEKIMFEGGVFGFAISDHGTVRLVHSMNSSEKKGLTASIKAFLMMLFPPKEYLYRTYKYSDKCHLLLPIAFFHRLFDAIFKRGKSNKNAVKNLFTNNDTAIMISDIINELDIKL